VHSSKINTLFCPCCDLFFEATRNVRPILQHMQELHAVEVPFRYHCCSNALYRMHWFKFCSTVLAFGRQPYPTQLADIQLCIHLGLDQKNMRWSVNDVHQNSNLEPPWPSSLMPAVAAPAATPPASTSSSSRASSAASSSSSGSGSDSSSPASSNNGSPVVSRKRSRTATKTLYDELSKNAAASAASRARPPSAPPSRPSPLVTALPAPTSSMPIVVTAQRAMRTVTDETLGLAALIASIDDDEMAMATMQPPPPPQQHQPPPLQPLLPSYHHHHHHHHQQQQHHMLFSYPQYHQHQAQPQQQQHHYYPSTEPVHSKEVPVMRDNSKRRRVEVDPTSTSTSTSPVLPPSSLPSSFSRPQPTHAPTFYDDNFLARIRSLPVPSTSNAAALHGSADYSSMYHQHHQHHQDLQRHHHHLHLNGHQYYPHHAGSAASNYSAYPQPSATADSGEHAMHRRASAPMASMQPHSPLMHPSPPFHPAERERPYTLPPVEPVDPAQKRGMSISDLINNNSSSSSGSSSVANASSDATTDATAATNSTTLFVPKKKVPPKLPPLSSAECPPSECNAVPNEDCSTTAAQTAAAAAAADQACVPTPAMSWPDLTPSQPAASQLMVDQSNLFGNI